MNPFSAGRKRFRSGMMLMVMVSALVFSFLQPAFGESAGHGDSNEAPVKKWQTTDWARVLNFAVLAGVLFYLVRKPFSQMLSDRIAGIKEQLSELEEKKQGAAKELAMYNEKLTQLGKEAEKIVDEYIRQGNEAKERILKEAKSSAEKLEEKAMKNIDHEFKQAKLKLQAEITEKALAKAEAKIISRISSEDQNRLVDEYLEKVVA
ncbi:MAG: ATP synthase F0 subunit B [Desulfobacteraceae bacterium]|nr:ATP synthase F0 subunit B [Desulfobacteraceae bacterium]MBU4054439.1 ATP synthase F0 subunit B [Pseudomonadota bacterium]